MNMHARDVAKKSGTSARAKPVVRSGETGSVVVKRSNGQTRSDATSNASPNVGPTVDATSSAKVKAKRNAAQEQQLSGILEQLLLLEGELREADTERALAHFVCNETRRIVPHHQAMYFAVGLSGRAARLRCASGTSRIDANAPAVRAIERFVNAALKAQNQEEIGPWPIEVPLEASERFRHGLLIPLKAPARPLTGYLLLLRENAFLDAETVLSWRLGAAYGHAFAIHDTTRRRAALAARSRRIGLSIAALAVLAMFIPVPFSAVAPMEITAKDAQIVTSPLDGVVRSINVEPGSTVRAGDIVATMEDTDLAGAYDAALRAFGVSQARYRRASQGASASSDLRRELAVTLSEVQLAQSEMETAKARLERSVVRAQASGIAIFSDPDEWAGRPVATGERIMEIGDPEKLEVTMELPLADAAMLGEGIKARAFLDADPLNAFELDVSRMAYRAEQTPDGRLAYKLKAQLGELPEGLYEMMRIGLRGTARVSNGKVMLGYFLFRKPLGLARQWFVF